MAAAPDPWASIKAAYLSEGDVAALATARKLGIRTLEVIPYLRAWKAETAAAAKAPPIEPHHELILAKPIDVTESAESVTKTHKRMSAQLSAVLEHELEEMQGMVRLASSFVDADHIETLKAKAIAGDSKPLADYIAQAVKARKLVGELVEKLARAINQAIQSERAVWGLDGVNDKGNEANIVNWIAILDELRKPIPPLSLPEHVASFERKLTLVRGGRRDGA